MTGKSELARIIEKCTGCNLCVKECSFLQRTGNPAELATGSREYNPFECALCGLCIIVCPAKVDSPLFFLERRREIRRGKGADDPRHSPLLAYERKGTSRRYNFYGLPEGCDVVFFPGCALPGSRPHTVWKVYEHLKKYIPKLGIVLDCCLKPSHDLGREEHFNKSFMAMRGLLYELGVRKVLVACPNCNRIFTDHGGDISVQTVYEVLADLPGMVSEEFTTEVVFHDPCVARTNRAAQDAARNLVMRFGAKISEMSHSREMTQCCGRGGGVNFIAPGIINESVTPRVAEADGRPIITYCAACAGTFSKKTQSLHLLDLWMSPKDALAGLTKVSSAPMTYLNRIMLKGRFRNCEDFLVMRERGGSENMRKASLRFKALMLLLMIFTTAVVVRFTGVGRLI